MTLICGTTPLAKVFRHADCDEQERLARYFDWVPPGVFDNVYQPHVQQELVGQQHHSLDPLLAALDGLPPGTPALHRMLYLDGKFFLADHNLTYTDKTGMASGV